MRMGHSLFTRMVDELREEEEEEEEEKEEKEEEERRRRTILSCATSHRELVTWHSTISRALHAT